MIYNKPEISGVITLTVYQNISAQKITNLLKITFTLSVQTNHWNCKVNTVKMPPFLLQGSLSNNEDHHDNFKKQ